MKRRTFLSIGVGVTAVGAGLAYLSDRLGSRPLATQWRRLEGFGRAPAARLRQHFAWLEIDPAAIDSYLADYRRHYGELGRFSIPDEKFFTRFLLSTDFFANGGERPREGTPVKYMTYYSPSESPCYNPLALQPPTDAELASAPRRPR